MCQLQLDPESDLGVDARNFLRTEKTLKSWTYKQITEEAERQITALMEDASRKPKKEDQALLRQWAYGVYLGWNRLTMGWMEDGDDERLKALTNL
jgi:hypothetical protein